jgi:molybdopterin-containing oxidoreductase family iron-sulfur binding subunit
MSEKVNDENKSSRRKFLQNLGLIGSGALAASAALYSGYHYKKSKNKSSSKIKVLTPNNQLAEIDVESLTIVGKPTLEAYQALGRHGIKNRRWVMVIDLAKCRNARKCISACQEAHHLKPEQFHINTLQMQNSEKTGPYFMPKPCQHCDNPPCVSVCPVDATFKRPDGPVLIDNERCIGCRFCIAACPYSARIFNWLETNDEKDVRENKTVVDKNDGTTKPAKDIIYNVELNVPQKKGTVSKCLFSSDRIREGKLPYCVSACPNGVYYFGDENEDAVTNGTSKETVKLSKLLHDNGGYRLMEELGTNPRVYYLPPKNRLFPFPEEKVTDKES